MLVTWVYKYFLCGINLMDLNRTICSGPVFLVVWVGRDFNSADLGTATLEQLDDEERRDNSSEVVSCDDPLGRPKLFVHPPQSGATTPPLVVLVVGLCQLQRRWRGDRPAIPPHPRDLARAEWSFFAWLCGRGASGAFGGTMQRLEEMLRYLVLTGSRVLFDPCQKGGNGLAAWICVADIPGDRVCLVGRIHGSTRPELTSPVVWSSLSSKTQAIHEQDQCGRGEACQRLPEGFRSQKQLPRSDVIEWR